MDYEKKYKEALKRAKKFEEKYGGGYAEYIFPELTESEDERIRKELKEAFEAYDIESKWNGIPIRSIFAWLEKQKEKSEIPIMDGDTDTYFDDLRMTTKPLTSREWFDEGIKYAQRLQKEQKPEEQLGGTFTSYDMAKTFTEGQNYVIAHPEKFDLCKPAEWSEEDEKMLRTIISDGSRGVELDSKQISFLKSLRPSWKPSEEQMKALEAATVRYQSTGLESLYEDLKKL